MSGRRRVAVQAGAKAPSVKTPTLGDVGGKRRQDLDRRVAPAVVLRDVRGGRAGGAQAVRSRLRDTEVLQELDVRPDPRQGQSRRDGPSGPHVHQRRAVQVDARRRPAPTRPGRQRPAPDGAGDRRLWPAVGAVCLRRRRRRHRQGIVRTDLHAGGDRRGTRGSQVGDVAGASSSRMAMFAPFSTR